MNTPRQLGLDLNTVEEGVVMTHRFVLPYLPPSKNQYDAWPGQWKSGVKKKWLRDIAAHVEEQQIPLDVPMVGIAARLVFPTKRRRDLQNYSNCLHHFVCDGLVRAGVISDDHEGKIQIGPNWGITMAVDLRPNLPKTRRSRTIIAVSLIGARPRV